MQLRKLFLLHHQVAFLYRSVSSSFYTINSKRALKNNEVSLARQLETKIKLGGPITVAEYMREVLTNPLSGYYMNRDMFGQAGDFITSPELGQVFGELIALWFLNEWAKAGSPKPINLIELGPGRGSLCWDLLRIFNHFRLHAFTSVHLVEVSPCLSDIQARRLCREDSIISVDDSSTSVSYKRGCTTSGVKVHWYRHFDNIFFDNSEVEKNAFTLLVANEFFDALPVHKFKKTERGYREVMVDLNENRTGGFRFVLSKEESLVGKVFIKPNETRENVEVSPDSLALAQKIGMKLEEHGGLALIADYGHDGTIDGDTFRAFKGHKQHDPLIEPGSADLTADVDFTALKQAATTKLSMLGFGPITQKDFLMNMGLEYRLEMLRKNAKKEQLEGLEYGYKMLVDSDKMGNRFKFLAVVPEALQPILDRHPMTGF